MTLAAPTAKRIIAGDISFRTKMLKIASALDDIIAMGRGDPDFHTPAHICEAAKRRAYPMRTLKDLGFSYGFLSGAFYIYTNISSSGLKAPAFCETLLREERVLLLAACLVMIATLMCASVTYSSSSALRRPSRGWRACCKKELPHEAR